MDIVTTALRDVLLIKPQIFTDERGYFYEPYNKKRFIEAGIGTEFVQDNESLSSVNTLRGLHFQQPPFDQGKLVTVVKGTVLDVVVDIRKKSPDYGKSFSVQLDGVNKWMLWVPPGFAHGFSTLEDGTIFQYKCTNYYHKNAEGGILWNDPDLNINWGTSTPVISAKDQLLPPFNLLNSPF